VARDSFHHGNLRAELLERAEAVLRDGGVENLSLRELAREAGVSHGAPRAHFVDRAALLDALAERAFDRLAEIARSAVVIHREEPLDTVGALRVAGQGYLEYAESNGALLALMVAAKSDDRTGRVHDASLRLFADMVALVALALGLPDPESPTVQRLTLLFSATLQGIASLVASGRVDGASGAILLDDAIAVLAGGAARVDARAKHAG